MKWLPWMCLGLVVSSWAYVSHFRHPYAQAAGDTQAAASSFQAPATIHGIGYVEPATELRRLMLRTGGVIRRIYVASNDNVARGQRILELDNTTHLAEVAVARQNLGVALAEAEQVKSGINPLKIQVEAEALERLRADLRYSQLEAERLKNLLTRRAISQQEWETSASRLRQAEARLKEKEAEIILLKKHVTPEQCALAQARVQHARAALELAEERLRETVLLAPCDGVVLQVLKREGEGVRMFEPEPVVLFGDLSKLRIRAEIDERFVTQLAAGQEAFVYGRNMSGTEYRGKVAIVEPIMGDKTMFSGSSFERKDLNTLQVVIEMEAGFRAPIGLQVDVGIAPGGPAHSNIRR